LWLCIINCLIEWKRWRNNLKLRAHSHPQGNVAGPNQPNLQRNSSLLNVWGTEKSSEGLTRSWWGPRGTKRSVKKDRRKSWCVLRSFFHSRLCACFDNKWSGKKILRLNKQRKNRLLAKGNLKAWWSVRTIYSTSLSLLRSKQFICARFFQICRQERTKIHARNEETRLTFGLVSTKRRFKRRLTTQKVP
jgi:hypothetical protein